MIHKFNTFNENIEDNYEDDYQDNDTPPYEEDDIDEGMDYILYLLRNTIKNKGISNFTVDNFEDYNISITVETSLKEQFSEITSIFKVISYLKSDIIPQYESDFFMYQMKGKNVLEFEFILQ